MKHSLNKYLNLKMNKQNYIKCFLSIMAWCLTGTLPFEASAQKKALTIQDAVLGLSSNLAVKNLRQLQWMGDSPYYSQVISNDSEKVILMHNPQNFDTETVLSLEKMNQLLISIGRKELKSFPPINWLSASKFYIQTDNAYILFSSVNNQSYFASVWAQLPEKAEHIEMDKKSMSISYTHQHNIYINRGGAEPIQVTFDGHKNLLYGTSVHRDEFGIHKGLFWSPNANKLAFYKMDQSMVADYPIVNWGEVPASVTTIKYPMAGRTSHQVKLGVFDIKSQKTIYLQTGDSMDHYLTCVTWSPDEKFIYLALLNRDQNHLKLQRYDAFNGQLVATLFEEKNEKYVEPQHELFFINNDPSRFIWWSQRSGYMHLYLYRHEGTLIRPLTQGKWLVNEILGYQTESNEILFTSTKLSPMDKTVHAVNIDNGKMRDIIYTPGIHNAAASADARYLIDVHSSKDVPRTIEVMDANNSLLSKRLLTASNPLENYTTASTELLTIMAADGSTPLYAKLMKPHDFDPGKKYPVIVYLYNGPHLQLNRNSFPYSGNLWYDYMTQKGYLVFVVDGRGSSNRGFDFESATHRQLGTAEMDDQLQGVKYLQTLPYVDATRMGVHGWSYGGFMTTSLMLRHPDVFKVGIAGGPVLDWGLYEIMYTERYMDSPSQNAEGYQKNTLLDKAKNLKGKLLLIHGTDDDVVVWQHSIQFLKKCVDDGVQTDYFVYPGHPHNVRGKDRVHLMQKITDYFDLYLKN